MYEDLNGRLRQALRLRGSSVAVTLSNERPELEEPNRRMRLCEMLSEAMYGGKSFYTSSEHHGCDGGAYHAGLRQMPEEMRSGEFLHKRVGLFGSGRAARRFFNSNLGIEPGTVKFVSFSPLENARFKPDLVVMACIAGEGMRAVEASAYESGIGAKGMVGPVCSTVVAAPYLTGNVVYTLGDAAGRKFTRIDDGEILIGVPFEKVGTLLDGLERIGRAEVERGKGRE